MDRANALSEEEAVRLPRAQDEPGRDEPTRPLASALRQQQWCDAATHETPETSRLLLMLLRAAVAEHGEHGHWPEISAGALRSTRTAAQCESLAKEHGLYSEKRGGWITWEQAQHARVRCLNALHGYQGADQQHRKQLLMDAIVVTIFTYGPVDRVGVIRKLRVNETLVKDPA